jgi:hypothetical protein
MRRLRKGLLAAAVLGVLMVIDPVALIRLGGLCAVGGCGVRPLWLALAVAALLLACAAVRVGQARRDAKARTAPARRKRAAPRKAQPSKPRRPATAKQAR